MTAPDDERDVEESPGVDDEAFAIDDEEIPSPPPDPEETPTMDLERPKGMEGRTLGDYEILEKIGAGGMGEVYRARQVSLERTVAVKVLPRSLANQEDFIERFQREARSAANLVHAHVIQVYSIGVEDGIPYFAMEYVEGTDLGARMRESPLSYGEIAEILEGVASALACAYEKDIIHRDIKPSNIMLADDGPVKVMDFGLAKATQGDQNLTRSDIIMGTPNYISPEQGRGDSVDHRSDLYSLGVVLYEMLTDERPFRGDSPATIIYKHAYENPASPRELNEDVPPFFEEICLRLLAKSPDERYPNPKALLQDLHELEDHLEHYVSGGERRKGAGYLGGEDRTVVGPRDGAYSGDSDAFKEQPTVVDDSAREGGEEDAGVPPRSSGIGTVLAGLLILGLVGGSLAVATGVVEIPGVTLVATDGDDEGDGVDGGDGPDGETPDGETPDGETPDGETSDGEAPDGTSSDGDGSDASGTDGPEGEDPEGTEQPEVEEVPGPTTVQLSVVAADEEIVDHDVTAFLREGSRRRRVPLEDIPLEEGERILELTRPGYRDWEVEFTVRDGEVDPPPAAWDISFEPTEELVTFYEDGRAAMERSEWELAVRRLERVRDLDPTFRQVRDQLETARAQLEEQRERAEEVGEQLAEARRLKNEGRIREALGILRTLADDLPPGSDALLREYESDLDRVRERMESARTALEDGNLERARNRLGEAREIQGEPEGADALASEIDRARRLLEAGLQAFERENWEGTVGAMDALLEIAPGHREASEKLAAAREAIREAEELEERIASARSELETALDEERWEDADERARSILASEELSPLHDAAREARERARAARWTDGVEALFSRLDEALVEGRPHDALALIAAGPYLEETREEVVGFFREGIGFASSRHVEYDWVELEPEGGRINCVWEFTLSWPGVDRTTRGRVPQAATVRRTGDRWRFVSFEERGGVQVRTD